MCEESEIMQEAESPVFQAPEDAALAQATSPRYKYYMLQGETNGHELSRRGKEGEDPDRVMRPR